MRRNAPFFLWLFISCIAASVSGMTMPEKITIRAAAKKQPPVVFPHAEHTARVARCSICHHVTPKLTAESTEKVEKCSACHLDPKPGMPGMRNAGLADNPFHIRCIACHKVARKKGPVGCIGCHRPSEKPSAPK